MAKVEEKQGSSKRQNRGVTWPMVVGALQDDKTRLVVLAKYKTAGFAPDEFARLTKAREAAVEALVAGEDWLENEHPRQTKDRDALRKVRRALEVEVWP